MAQTRTRDDHTGDAAVAAVSIVVPAYNVAPFMTETLRSVFAQTYTDYEVIVVNDGSPDTEELEQVLAPYRSRLRYITQENRGVSAARNTALRAARAPLIALLDGDDVWEPDYLAVHVDMMQRDPTIDVLYGNALQFGNVPNGGRHFMDVCPSDGAVTFEALVAERCNVFVSVLARREAIVRAGMFDEDLHGVEDFDLWLRIVKGGGRITYHRRPLARYRKRPGSLSSDTTLMMQQILRVFDKVEQTLHLTSTELATLKRQRAYYRAALRLEEAKTAFVRRDLQSAMRGLAEANQFLNRWKLRFVMLLMRCAPRILRLVYDARRRFLMRHR